jgi:hypothetical protein
VRNDDGEIKGNLNLSAGTTSLWAKLLDLRDSTFTVPVKDRNYT